MDGGFHYPIFMIFVGHLKLQISAAAIIVKIVIAEPLPRHDGSQQRGKQNDCFSDRLAEGSRAPLGLVVGMHIILRGIREVTKTESLEDDIRVFPDGFIRNLEYVHNGIRSQDIK